MDGHGIAKGGGKFSGRHRIWLFAVSGIAVLVLLLMVLVPLLFNANTFRSLIERQIATALNRPVQLGNLSLSLFTGSLVADNVVIGDEPGPAPGKTATPLLQATALHIGVEPWPLLLHRQIIITRFVANQPRIHLVHLANGTWNFSSLGQGPHSAPSKADSSGSVSTTSLASAKLQITNGSVTVDGLPGTDRAFICQNVEVSAPHVSSAEPFPFQVSANLPAGATFSLQGTVGPLASGDVSNTPLNADISLKGFNPVASGLIDPAQGISFVADIQSKAISDGHTFRSTGSIRANQLKLARNGVASPTPVDATFDLAAPLAGGPNGTVVQVNDLQVKSGRDAAHLTGTVTLLPSQALLNAKLSAQQLPIDGLQALLPSAGVRLPLGAKLQGGTLTANLAITGPVSAARFNGPVDVEGTNLSGFNLGSKLNGLAALTGITSGNSTAIQSLRTDLAVGANGVDAQHIYAAVPSLGTATGAGTVSPAGALDFRLLVKVSSRAGAGSALGVVSNLGGLLGSSSSPLASGIPLTITGTQSDPHFGVSLPIKGTAAALGQLGSKGSRPATGQLLQNLFKR